MGKRTAGSGAASGAAAKRPKADPLTTKCDEVVAALKALPDMPATVREMLAVALPLAMVPENERHSFQESMITAVAEQMAKVEASLQAAVQQAEAQVGVLTKEKEECAAKASAAEATLSEKKAAAQEKKHALARDAADVRTTKAELEEAQGKLEASEAEVMTAEADLGDLKTAVAEVFTPLQAGSFEQVEAASKAAELVGKLHRLLKMEDSLITVAPAALSKPPAARGPFELMVVNELTDQCTKRLDALAAQVAAGAPAKAANAEAVGAVQVRLLDARKRQRVSAEAFTAARTEQEQCEATHATAAKALKVLSPS